MLETTFFYCAAVGGIFLLLQLVMMLLGGDDGGDFDAGGDVDVDFGADADAEGHSSGHDSGFWVLEIVSLRTLAAATMFFGLTGLTARAYELPPVVALALAVAAGFAAMYAVYWAFKQMFKLQSSGSEDVRNAVGQAGQVYVSIPASDQGMGKVHFEMQGRTVEYQARTKGSQPLSPGDAVEVVGVINSDTVEVRAANQSAK